MRHLHRPLLALLLISLFPSQASADPSDAPLLTAILTNAVQQFRTLGDVLHTAKQEYQEVQRLASYAQDARAAFASSQKMNQAIFDQSLENALDNAYPEVGFFRNQLAHPDGWSEGSGELNQVVRVCFGAFFSGSKCTELQQAQDAKKTLLALQRTFGVAPDGVPGSMGTQAMDRESATAIAASLSYEQRLALRKAQLEQLEQECLHGSDLATCQNAASMAQIMSAEVQTSAAQQQALANRLAALQLAQKNGEQKQQLREQEERKQLMKEAAAATLAAPVQMKTKEGWNLVEEGKP